MNEQKQVDIFEGIFQWNQERKLIPGTLTLSQEEISNNLSFCMEELIEAKTDMDSAEARPLAKQIISNLPQSPTQTKEQVVDAMCDNIVFSIGLIEKLGYNSQKAMEEVLKEINSRKGSIIDGKFIKDKSPKAQALWYKASFDNAKRPKL